MDKKYAEAFSQLNDEQRKAVTTLDGPVLVIAGPGTGKTQLISTRVGHILKHTDTTADSILLLTFTDAGVQAMRERLIKLIGRQAYDIQVSTYHAFGGEVFRRYRDYFEGAELSLIEELGADSLLRSIIAKLPYSNPLKFADNYIGELRGFISEAKRALLSPEDIEKIADANLDFIKKMNQETKPDLEKLHRISKKTLPVFENILDKLKQNQESKLPGDIGSLARYATEHLRDAIDFFESSGEKTTQLTSWKKTWLAKDQTGKFIFDGQRQNDRLKAAAGIYRQYQKNLKAQHLYDYDDMILRASSVLEANPEIKYSLAERYSYIMLDEFQDTNPAQFQLVKLLTDHPVHEGRPNILAVGDDDQAIYAFQGADYGNMSDFSNHYREVKLISLKDNYRSHKELIETAQNISAQISNRLHDRFKGISKKFVAAAKQLPEPVVIQTREFKSDAAQNDWIAAKINELVSAGTAPSDIAVLAPKHRYIEPLLPYLSKYDMPIRYERRENVLEQPVILQLERMSQLILALSEGNETIANIIWPEILSYDFWQVDAETIWRINWQSRDSNEPWTAILLNDEKLNPTASFFLRLAAALPINSLENQLDALIGLPGSADKLKLPFASPLYEYYFSKESSQKSPSEFATLISDLIVLRSHLREWRLSHQGLSGLRALVEFAEGHRAAKLNILNTSPYHDADQAVNLLTAYGAKGREFKAVFLVSASDEVWGNASRNQGYRLSLPANLSHIRYQGASENERLRLLYVAATRAQSQLYITSYAKDLAGKHYSRLQYLDITEDENGHVYSGILPEKFREIHSDESDSLPTSAYLHSWMDKHTPPHSSKMAEILKPVLLRFQLSATHLNQFTDIVNAGPDSFFIHSLLAFPTAPTETTAFGTAIHNTLRFIGNILSSEGKLPARSRVLEIFQAQLSRIELALEEQRNLEERGQAALTAWLQSQAKQLKRTDRFEYDFRDESSTHGNVRLAGKVDRLIIDEKTKKITVVDYKTGQSYARWQSSVVKLHKFRQQLLFYKILIESSARYRGYNVDKGIIEFIEPDENGKINHLELFYQNEELGQIKKLISKVWQHIQNLDFPETDIYQPTLSGIKKFEADLLSPKKNAG